MTTPQAYNSYAFDPQGTNPANLITGEQQVLTGANGTDWYYIIPQLAPFFETGLVVTYTDTSGNTSTLTNGIDYSCTNEYIAASRACATPIWGSITFMDLELTGVVTLQYQTLGGEWCVSMQQIATILANTLANPRITSWDEV